MAEHSVGSATPRRGLMWDGRESTVFTQAKGPFLGAHEMANASSAGIDRAVVLSPRLAELSRLVEDESDQQGHILASSIHIHFMLDGDARRSKAEGAAALLSRRGVTDANAELSRYAVSVGDSANDVSLFAPGRFALSVGVRNIERYLPELGSARPRHITHAPEGHGLVELLDALLKYHRPTS